MQYLYGWSDELIALFANYGSIMYIVAFIPVVFLLQKSLRSPIPLYTLFIQGERHFIGLKPIQVDNEDDI